MKALGVFAFSAAAILLSTFASASQAKADSFGFYAGSGGFGIQVNQNDHGYYSGHRDRCWDRWYSRHHRHCWNRGYGGDYGYNDYNWRPRHRVNHHYQSRHDGWRNDGWRNDGWRHDRGGDWDRGWRQDSDGYRGHHRRGH